MELYIHFPFCRQKCRYCDFVSFPGMEDSMDAYITALLREAELCSGDVAESIETVYFGGGTPSLIPSGLMRRLTRGLAERLPLGQVREWTSEANPGTLTQEWADAARSCGITRLSLGMQAYQPRLLALLGRIHRFEEVRKSFETARKASFQNLSVDLIFGIPSQTLSDWSETLTAAFSLFPDHLSAYGLIPEENTPLWQDLQNGSLSLPEDEEERAMYSQLLTLTRRLGYQQYEISNFAKPGFECIHNIGYWNQTPYLGLGVSASSMVHLSRSETGIRYLRRTNTDRLEEYLKGIAADRPVLREKEWIEAEEARFETMMLGLRMNRGVSENTFFLRHGVPLQACYGKRLDLLRQQGFLFRESDSWKLTRKGMDLQNTVLVSLMD